MRPLKLRPGRNCLEYAYVGSRVTCDPAPTDTDRDILVLIHKEHGGHLFDQILCKGGEWCTMIDYGDSMDAMRLGDDNFIITDCPVYFQNFLRLTAVVKHLNIMDKETRHAVFKAMIDGDQSLLKHHISSTKRAPKLLKLPKWLATPVADPGAPF